MSGPLRSLKNSSKRPNGQVVERKVFFAHTERQKTILKSNVEEEAMADVSWTPPEAWMKDISSFETTNENFGWRKNRATMVLRYLLKETSELIEQPSLYISDIW